MEFSAVVAFAELVMNIGTRIKSTQKSAKGHKRKILLELEENVELISLWKNKGFPIDKVILKLERSRYDSAVDVDFNINSIKSTALKKSTTKGVPQFQKYVGWSTEKLLNSLYRKIRNIKHIVDMDSESKHVSKSARLGNIYKITILLIHHIES